VLKSFVVKWCAFSGGMLNKNGRMSEYIHVIFASAKKHQCQKWRAYLASVLFTIKDSMFISHYTPTKIARKALLDLNKTMGALFRIRLLQYWFILSLLVWHAEIWYRVAVPLHYSELPAHLFELLPSALSLLVILCYSIWRKTVMLPLLLTVSSAWYLITSTELDTMHLYWFFAWMVMIAFPFFYYKFQDFKQMVSMYRWMLLVGAIGLMTFSIRDGADAATITMNSLFVLGTLGFFLQFLKPVSAVFIVVGAGWMVYSASMIQSWPIAYLYLTQIVATTILFADPFSRELPQFLWLRYPYFRVIMFVLLIMAVIPFIEWPQDSLAGWFMSLLPTQEINS
jgi:hypothetical protein